MKLPWRKFASKEWSEGPTIVTKGLSAQGPNHGRICSCRPFVTPVRVISSVTAFSRTPGQQKRYVQDAMRERQADLAPLLAEMQSLARAHPTGQW